ncbi:VOC family protein [Agromyces aureus]|uniref:VOC domain-containing protein n=1 Tax=Agromyces aureus TaxID=453304 RepID=A0A191WEP6_9MICO|nr:glyoxalase/bleomycin resistance/dioxygenase family protein [Agromyces aureus]ANJ26654.1 hypothetical protein ATC03_07960 [Agromyces aureus]
MQLRFIYVPVDDLPEAVAVHRDVLGLAESWREGDDTVAFALADSDVQIMVSTAPGASGPMYEVEDLDAWLNSHAAVVERGEVKDIPDGRMVELDGPDGNAFYVFDQPGRAATD